MRYTHGLFVLICAAAPGLAAGTPSPAPAAAPARVITRDQRIRAQEKLERVYDAHRIWPEENPGPRPSFEQRVPATLLERKALEPLRMSAALHHRWGVVITPAMLQAELERMARESRDPARLRELFAALDDDPRLIAETLGRGTLAERMVRERYAVDPALHADVRRRAEAAGAQLAAGRAWNEIDGRHARRWIRLESGEPETPAGGAEGGSDAPIAVPEAEWLGWQAHETDRAPGTFVEREDGFVFARVLARREGALEVESLVIPKRSFDAWWAEAGAAAVEEPGDAGGSFTYRLPESPHAAAIGCDVWEPGKLFSAPAARNGHSAIWTGSEMIVWGGGGTLRTGGRYNPATNSWQPISAGTNVPTGRSGHTAIWTGTEMIIWGLGSASLTNTGGRYNPNTDSWQPTSTGANVPSTRRYHSAVWTGTRMIIWGGVALNTGGLYDPATDSWLPTSIGVNVPLGRQQHTAVWTGSVMVVWGGVNAGYLNTGGLYDPVTDSWLPSSLGANLPVGRNQHTAIWSGSEMIVWGGYNGTASYLNSGGRYNPVADTWLPTSVGAGVPTGRITHTAIWTGTELIVWGGGGYTNTGGRYSPATDSWLATPTGANVPLRRSGHTAVWTGTEMIVWGGADFTTGTVYYNNGGRFNPAADTWATTSRPNIPRASGTPTAVWTGAEMILWGNGGYGGVEWWGSGARYDPALDAWTPTSTGANVPEARGSHTAIWSGTEMIVWGGYAGVTLNSGGRYDPVGNSWATTSTGTNVPQARTGHKAIWTGTEMIVWGMSESTNPNTGGRYNPATNSWLPTSTGANVPGGRAGHTLIWTGNEMIVWGGSTSGLGFIYNSGARYAPATDSWLPVSTGANTPAARWNATAVWTGAEMIVWGGTPDGNTTVLNTGGRYNPATDSWSPTSLGANLPAGRSGHSGIWAGQEMVVWGGSAGAVTNSGGRYRPASDSWSSTLVGTHTPDARSGHHAVMTDAGMLIWGGSGFDTGGNYVASVPAGVAAGAVAAAPNRIDLSWPDSATAEVSDYTIRRSMTPGGPYTVIASVTDSSPGVAGGAAYLHQDTPVSGGTTYYYRITANYGPRCGSLMSSETSALATGNCLFSPTFAGAGSATNNSAGQCGVTLAWPAAASNCGGATTYEIFRSTSTGFTPAPVNRIATGIATTGHVDTDALDPYVRYHYLVRAVDPIGNTEANGVERAATPTGPFSAVVLDDAGDTGAAQLTGTAPWSVAPTGGVTNSKVYQTGAYTNNLCATLTSPTFQLTPYSTVSFASKYDIQSSRDKGIVELSTDGGVNWSKLDSVNYPGSSSQTGDACGLGATGPAFTGSNSSYNTYNATLTGYAGANNLLRYRFSSDATTTRTGWWIDNLVIQTASACGSCASTPMSGVTLGKSGTDVVHGWSPVAGAVSYRVHRKSSPSAIWPVPVATGLTGTGWSDPDQLSNTTTYFYSVTDINGCGAESPR